MEQKVELEYCAWDASVRAAVEKAGGEIKMAAAIFLAIDPITNELAVQVYDDDGKGNGNWVLGVVLEKGKEVD